MRHNNTSKQSLIGRITARPATTAADPLAGLQRLEQAGGRDALLYIPPQDHPDRPLPLAVLLHGAGGDAQHGLRLLQSFADATGIALLAPSSRRETWDVIFGRYGPDVDSIDQVLAQVFARYAIDPAHLAIGGFSDGASYALSLGLTNGDLFTHIIAFSPGFVAPASQQGKPRVYVSHGLHDTVLPIDPCSRRIVPLLQEAGYEVQYREFNGPHTVPPNIVEEAVAWFCSASP